MKEQKYVCGANKAVFAQYQLNFSSSTAVAVVEPPPSNLIRRSAHSFSSSVKKPAAAGVSGMKKKQMTPNTTVIAPSTVTTISITPQTRFPKHILKKIQGHRSYPPTSIFANPDANSPPNAPLNGAAQ